jgi:hypothetical protein
VDDAYNPGQRLNICGENAIEDVRILADTLFSSTALGAGTTVEMPFALKPTFTGSGSFRLRFEKPLKVSPDPVDPANPKVRILTGVAADSNSVAVAELIKNTIDARGRTRQISLGRYVMPCQIRVTRL